MVLNDLLGGELIRGEVRVNGEFRDYHWWNRIGMGVEIDLTRGQFRPEETVTGGTVVPRRPVTEWRRLREEYELLRSRVMEELDRDRSGSGEPPGGPSRSRVRLQTDLAQSRNDARPTAASYEVAVFSYLVAIPRKPLRRLKQRSTTLRRR
ncbi:hypothetical protein SHXM_00035 [Streptomyces hygroscopicus]|nr:hypothetical protein SHXM_00035 [Streptomyces hygroscopicus]